jgi:exodeoxyribonuclease-3
MRIISFCADGIESAAEKGFFDWALEQDADIICIQDLRAQEYDLQDNVYFPEGYFPYFYDSPHSINGVAIYVRQMPKAIMTGLGFGELDIEARYIQADFENVSIGSILVPSAFSGNAQEQEQKEQFCKLLQNHLSKIRNKRREYIFCGSWFMAHQESDVQNAAAAADKPGFLASDRANLDALYRELGYIDGFRRVSSDADEFTFWPDGDRDKGNAMRTDLQVLSHGLRNNIEYGLIYKKQAFSSHAPLIMDYDIELN